MKMASRIPLTESTFLLLSLFLLASCGGGGGGSNTPPPASTVQNVACTGTASATVNAVGTSNFNPAGVTILVNQIVQWNNNSGNPHTVTRTTQPAGGTFDVALNNGTSVCLQFTATGVFDYFCTIHPNMTGSVTVTP